MICITYYYNDVNAADTGFVKNFYSRFVQNFYLVKPGDGIMLDIKGLSIIPQVIKILGFLRINNCDHKSSPHQK